MFESPHTALIIVRGPLDLPEALPSVVVRADRITLEKRRWRGVADDGREFGFDLETPLRHGDCFYQDEAAVYRIEQSVEEVLEVALPTDPEDAAMVGWTLGNLHFPIHVVEGSIRVANDSAIRQALERNGLHYQKKEAVFIPAGVRSHGHGHRHDHAHHHDAAGHSHHGH